jgi:hypothetical protein
MSYRYFMHVKDGDLLAEDPEGVELDDLAAARTQAIAGGREMLAEKILAGEPLSGFDITICGEDGEPLDHLSFSDFVLLSR